MVEKDHLISVITVHLNQFEGLFSTMESVQLIRRAAKEKNIEWVVIDGASRVSDEREQTVFDCVRKEADLFISEPDRGIYDAMNKGIARAQGKYLSFMNAGDIFTLDPEACANLIRKMEGNHPAAIYYGNAFEKKPGEKNHKKVARRIETLWYGMPTHHQAFFFKADLLKGTNYNIEYKIAADYELICRLYMRNEHIEKVDADICQFHLDGLSSNHYFQGVIEQQQVRCYILKMGYFENGATLVLKVISRFFRVIMPSIYSQLRYSKASTSDET